MQENKIRMSQARCGMQLSRTIYYNNGLVLLPKGAILTSKGIVRLRFYGIEELFIYHSKQEENSQKSEIEDYIIRTRKTEGFKQFDKLHTQSVNLVKNTFNGMIRENSKVNTDTLVSEVNNLLNNSENSIQVFDMLHCIRDYDDSTYVHCVNVSLISNILGKWIGFCKEDIETLTLCGLLHDIGKLMMPKEIIKKPSRLTDDEFTMIKKHPYMGYTILQQDIDEHVKNAVLQHHEKCDGSGYPNGLMKDQIDEFAKIVTIADVYDAMTANRVYRKGICPFDVIEILEKEGFEKYEPRYLLIFLERIVESYISRGVQLSNNEKGEIIMINKCALSKPVVRIQNHYIDLSRKNDLSIKSLI